MAHHGGPGLQKLPQETANPTAEDMAAATADPKRPIEIGTRIREKPFLAALTTIAMTNPIKPPPNATSGI